MWNERVPFSVLPGRPFYIVAPPFAISFLFFRWIPCARGGVMIKDGVGAVRKGK